MKCAVEGCIAEGKHLIEPDFHFCLPHSNAWGYYFSGYRRGREMGDRVTKKFKRERLEAIQEFLFHCAGEIEFYTRLAMAR